MPILMGLYMSLSTLRVTELLNTHFLWFDLTQPDLIMTIIRIMYFVQPLVNSIHYPKDQRKHITL